jgi:pilus assembly protein Flp/PilA
MKGNDMNKMLKPLQSSVKSFVKDEEGAQVVEYALIIAVVSIGLVVALGDATTGLRSAFATLITRVTTCFTAGSTCS